MAIDEAVFRETVKKQKPPTLRFYGWRPSAISIGYFQELKNEIDSERCRLAGVDIVRRITGGKAVYHKDDITYSLMAGTAEKLFPNDIARTYEIISLCLARGLSHLGIDAHLAKAVREISGKDRSTTSCCFSVPSGNELLVAGRKICGSAQTRTHGGFLQHGSMLMTFHSSESAALIRSKHATEEAKIFAPGVTAVNEVLPVPVCAQELCSVLQQGFVEELGIDFQEGPLTDAECALSHQLIKKYRSDAWNRERKKGEFSSG